MAQTFEDFEFIICDNASTDGTSEICMALAESDDRVRYYRHPTNLGAARNHNRVVELARGEYFKWCGHDDLIEPTFVEKCVDVLDADVDHRFVLCFTLLDGLDEDGNTIEGLVQSPQFGDPSPSSRLRRFWQAPRMHQVIYSVTRRESLMQTGLLGEWYGSDRQVLVELALLGGFARVDELLFHHREHPGRSQYAADKVHWMKAIPQARTDLGHWRRLRRVKEILTRDYLDPRERASVAAEYLRYAVRRSPYWVPHLTRELTASAAHRRGLGAAPDE